MENFYEKVFILATYHANDKNELGVLARSILESLATMRVPAKQVELMNAWQPFIGEGDEQP